MITINVNDLPALTAEQAAFEIGANVSDFFAPGLYRVEIASRGELDFITYIGNDSTFQVESVEEVAEREQAYLDYEDIEEFYVAEMEDIGFVFSYLEEGYDLYVRVV